jgi:hypothetical protein
MMKVIAQEPPASTSDPSSSAAVVEVPSGLTACEYAEIRAFAHRVLQFIDKMKIAADERDGEYLSNSCSIVVFLLLTLSLCNCMHA